MNGTEYTPVPYIIPDEEKERRDAEEKYLIIRADEAAGVARDVGMLGKYVQQMGQMMAAMQRRLDDLEARQAQVTISHAEVKRLNQLIRIRADEICGKYGLEDPESVKKFRAAIKKDLQRRYGVKDLHDLPEASLAGAENMIGRWVNTRMAMERRGMYGRV